VPPGHRARASSRSWFIRLMIRRGHIASCVAGSQATAHPRLQGQAGPRLQPRRHVGPRPQPRRRAGPGRLLLTPYEVESHSRHQCTHVLRCWLSVAGAGAFRAASTPAEVSELVEESPRLIHLAIGEGRVRPSPGGIAVDRGERQHALYRPLGQPDADLTASALSVSSALSACSGFSVTGRLPSPRRAWRGGPAVARLHPARDQVSGRRSRQPPYVAAPWPAGRHARTVPL
jgi:hypothetical protein